MLAGLAGGFFAHFYSFISPANFAASRVVDDLMFLVVGGLSPLGAAVGAIGLTLLPQVSSGLELWAPAIYGAVVIATMAILRTGCCPRTGWPPWRGGSARPGAPERRSARLRGATEPVEAEGTHA